MTDKHAGADYDGTVMRLHDYLERIGGGLGPERPALRSTARADVETLRQLHAAHRQTFLFENLTIQTGGRISLALADLERKFIDERRGGYCFEHNTLFASALREIGFAPITLLGRVRRGPPERWCRTHMVLRIPIDGEVWLADVGFGSIGLIEPMPLRDGATSNQGGFEYSFRRDGPLWVLSMRDAVATQDLYEFSEDPQTPWDVEVANHFTSTHPQSVFRRTLTIQRTAPAERIVLRNDVITKYRDGRTIDAPLDRGHLHAAARELFGITLPDGPFVFDSYAAGV
jgi:N-hydroxyarylamine O-acetyltransferase